MDYLNSAALSLGMNLRKIYQQEMFCGTTQMNSPEWNGWSSSDKCLLLVEMRNLLVQNCYPNGFQNFGILFNRSN